MSESTSGSVKMPEPFYFYCYDQAWDTEEEARGCWNPSSAPIIPIYTADQLEAYAAAKVEEAVKAEREKLAEYREEAERYRVVRCMNPRWFCEVWDENIRTGEHFDDLIDAIRAAEPEKEGGE